MSYCRFSSDNWRCEVYVYEDVNGGWTTHVAGMRRMIPPVPDLLMSRFAMRAHEWSRVRWEPGSRVPIYPVRWREIVYRCWDWFAIRWHRLHMWTVSAAPMREIGLAFDGETHNDPTAGACADFLEMLRDVGYRVPQYAIDALREEDADPDRLTQ